MRTRLTTPVAGGQEAVLEFDCGGCYRMICHVHGQKAALLERLAQHPDVAVIAQNGGLLNHLAVRENLLLPIAYREKVEGQRSAELHREMFEMLCHCLGQSAAAAQIWLDRTPSGLGKLEKRLAGFVRALLTRPEILVFDHVFEDLNRGEIAQVLHWRRVFHSQFPFRILVFVDLDANALPEVPDCSTICPEVIAQWVVEA